MEDSLSEIINLDKEIVLHIKHIYEGSTYVWWDAELGVFSWRDAGWNNILQRDAGWLEASGKLDVGNFIDGMRELRTFSGEMRDKTAQEIIDMS